jgi:tripartite-type tricarboxylate transporter receptor subunit TctC
LLGVLLGRAADVSLIHVPYRSHGQVEAELLSGQTAAVITALGDVLSLESAGRLRILATSGAERSPRAPGVPTFQEQGFPTVTAVGWNAVYAPAGTPKAMLDQISAAIASTLRTPAVRAKFATLGVESTGTTPDELAAIIAADTAHWTPVVRAAGFSPESR